MPDERPSEVLGSLPRTRPHRRSEKRGARPAAEQQIPAEQTPAEPTEAQKPKGAARKPPAKPKMRQPAQPTGTPAARARTRRPATPAKPRPAPPSQPVAKPSSGDIVGTAVQAAAELAEIGLAVSARALRRAIQRLPRP